MLKRKELCRYCPCGYCGFYGADVWVIFILSHPSRGKMRRVMDEGIGRTLLAGYGAGASTAGCKDSKYMMRVCCSCFTVSPYINILISELQGFVCFHNCF